MVDPGPAAEPAEHLESGQLRHLHIQKEQIGKREPRTVGIGSFPLEISYAVFCLKKKSRHHGDDLAVAADPPLERAAPVVADLAADDPALPQVALVPRCPFED